MRYFPLYEAKMFHQFDHRWATFGGSEVDRLEGLEDEEPTNLQTYDPTDLEDEDDGEPTNLQTSQPINPSTLRQKQDPRYLPTPRYWVSEYDVLMRAVPLSREEKKELEGMDPERVVALLRPRGPKWLIAFRDIARSTDERTAIFSALPLVGAGHNAPIIHLPPDAEHALCFIAMLDSLVCDWAIRQKVGGTHLSLNYFHQIAVLPLDWKPEIRRRVLNLALELVYTSEHLRPLAEEVCRSSGWEVCKSLGWEVSTGEGDEPPNLQTSKPINLAPFPYDEDRRAMLRAELDALVARLYGLNRKQLRYILCPQGLSWAELEDVNDGREDPTCSGPHALPAEPALDFPGETFRVLKEKEERRFGEYRTRRLVLEAWDRLWDELGPAEPLPVRFGGLEERSVGLEVGRFVGSGQESNLQTSQPINSGPISTGLFAEPPDQQTSQPANLQTTQPINLLDVAPEPKPPTPLKDKEGRIIRVRVLGASGQEIVAAGTVVGQRKQGEAVEWAVLVDETNAVCKFLSPPATLKRLKGDVGP